LPTEGEWECAARGGSHGHNTKYAGSNSIDDVAWYEGNSENKTHPVGQKQANELGFYDMSGNVKEWCLDQTGTGSRRTYRGGSCRHGASRCLITYGYRDKASLTSPFLGFRVALAPSVHDKTRNKKTRNEEISMPLVPVAPGSFQMGSIDGDDDEKPIHTVRISREYWMGKYEVTQRQYQSLMGYNPSVFEGNNNPVEEVNWHDAVSFCKKLTDQERRAGRLPEGYEYRLPTEAEWEYAARGGSHGHNTKYAGSNSLDDVAWCRDNSENKTHPVGQKQANELGLYDMSGNVYEWCHDWYGSYSSGSHTDPVGPGTGRGRVSRGGWCGTSVSVFRISSRSHNRPSYMNVVLGFRAVLAPPVRK